MLLVSLLLPILKFVPPVLQNQQWMENPLTPYVISSFNVLLIVVFAGLAVCVIVIVSGVVMGIRRRGQAGS